MDYWSRLPEEVFLTYFERYLHGWQRHNVLFIILLSASLILAYDSYKTLPNAVLSANEVYLPIGLLIILSVYVRFRFPRPRDITKNIIFDAIPFISWVLSIIYAFYLELHFTLRYLANPELSLNYGLSLLFFLVPFVSPFFNQSDQLVRK